MTFDFNKGGNGSGSGESKASSHQAEGDYQYHPRLYSSPEAVIEGDLGEMMCLTHDKYGDSVIYNITDAELVHGAMYEREKNGGKYRKFKMFGFGDLIYPNFDPEEHEFSAAVPEQWSENYFGKPYVFHRMGAQYGDKTFPEDADLSFDNLRIQVGTTSRKNEDGQEFEGPSSVAKRAIRLLAENGKNALNEDNFEQTSGWVDPNVSMAEELKGLRVQIWKTREDLDRTDQNGNSYKYNLLHVFDVETEQALPVRNGGPSNESEPESESDSESVDEMNETLGDSPKAVADGGDEVEFPDPVEQTIDWAAQMDIESREDILEVLEAPVEEGFVTQEQIDAQQEEIINEIQSRGN